MACAVLFDRDGTLVHDVPYNGDPDLVEPVDGAAEAVALVRAAGVRVGVVTNQSAVGSGRITLDQMVAVNARADALLGGLDVWACCPHAKTEGCACRKPAPGLVLQAAAALGVDCARVVVVGDVAGDVQAAAAAGATGVLVPTRRTPPADVAAAEHVAPDLLAGTRLALRLLGRGAG